jgi:hypothetical protein
MSDEQKMARIARETRARDDAAYAMTVDHLMREQNRRPSPETMLANAEHRRKREREEQHRQRLLEQDRIEDAERAKQREAELEPLKEAEWKRFKAEHPTATRATFETYTWPYIKQSRFSKEAKVQENIEKLKASGFYSF